MKSVAAISSEDKSAELPHLRETGLDSPISAAEHSREEEEPDGGDGVRFALLLLRLLPQRRESGFRR